MQKRRNVQKVRVRRTRARAAGRGGITYGKTGRIKREKKESGLTLDFEA